MRRKKVPGSMMVLLVVSALAGGFLLGLVSGAAPPVGHPASEVTPGTFAGSVADTFTFPGTVQAVSVSSPQITSSTLAATTAISSSGNIVTTKNFLEQNKKLCKADGTDCYVQPHGFAVFANPGTSSWTAPAGVTSVTVEVWGGGGGGQTDCSFGCNYAGGGGGGYGKDMIAVTPGTSYTVVVGSGGKGFPFSTDGGASSLGSAISATGGRGSDGYTGGSGGTSTAPIHVNGQRGQSVLGARNSGLGGDGGMGGSGGMASPGNAPGGGGGADTSKGYNGAEGRVIVWW